MTDVYTDTEYSATMLAVLAEHRGFVIRKMPLKFGTGEQKMTIDEAIRHCEEVAERNECKMTSDDGCTDVSMKQCAAEHRQLAEWLRELKDLRNSIGAIKLSNMTEALELIREYKAENMAQKKIIAEYKRLLKAAMKDMNTLYEAGKDEGCIGIKFKWRFAGEALKLIGDE